MGLVVAGALLLFARPTLRVGAAGLSVRNLLGYRLIPWSEVVGVSFPAGSRWARIDLPDDEYVPLMAIQAVDKDRAVQAMDTVRSLLARYRPDLPAHADEPSDRTGELTASVTLPPASRNRVGAHPVDMHATIRNAADHVAVDCISRNALERESCSPRR